MMNFEEKKVDKDQVEKESEHVEDQAMESSQQDS